LSELHDQRIRDLTVQDERHGQEVAAIREKFKSEAEEAESRWQQRLLDSIEAERDEKQKCEREWLAKEDKWEESRRNLESQVRSLQSDLREQETLARSKGKSSAQLQAAHRKLEEVQAEVESLKAVLEMRSDELKRLRCENARLEERLEETDRAAIELKKASALVEDLKAQIATKNNLERKLSAENRKLSCVVEREVTEKKRLSLENEELHWRIRQGSTDALSMSVAEGADVSCPLSAGGDDLSYSYTEGCTRSLPPMMGRTPRTNRISDPDFDPDSGLPSAADAEESPKVIEVVEKTESVSWRLEYEEQMRQAAAAVASPSPALKRKLSPMSPGLGRRRVTPPGSPAQLQRSSSSGLARKPAFEPLEEETAARCSPDEVQCQGKEEKAELDDDISSTLADSSVISESGPASDSLCAPVCPATPASSGYECEEDSNGSPNGI